MLITEIYKYFVPQRYNKLKILLILNLRFVQEELVVLEHDLAAEDFTQCRNEIGHGNFCITRYRK